MSEFEKLVKESRNVVCFLSGGMDSLLVLHQARQIREIPCIVFRQDFSDKQWSIIDNVIKLWDLEVYTFPPKHTMLLPNGGGLARADIYGLGHVDFPVIREYEHGDGCALQADTRRLETYPFDYDLALVGTLKSDSSPITGRAFKAQTVDYGTFKIFAPLFYWTKAKVEAEAKRLNLPYAKEYYENGDVAFETGTISACHKCILSDKKQVYCHVERKQIEVLGWDKDAVLNGFRRQYGFEVK